ncbi:hypothetical protein [Streptomyces sp. NPDC048266]|uniref:hypothetical protein n=1 Tax=unclassified Streptomyces TaxID=2593676 RepID=UPI003401FFDF
MTALDASEQAITACRFVGLIGRLQFACHDVPGYGGRLEPVLGPQDILLVLTPFFARRPAVGTQAATSFINLVARHIGSWSDDRSSGVAAIVSTEHVSAAAAGVMVAMSEPVIVPQASRRSRVAT